jgi:hypothetical protein
MYLKVPTQHRGIGLSSPTSELEWTGFIAVQEALNDLLVKYQWRGLGRPDRLPISAQGLNDALLFGYLRYLGTKGGAGEADDEQGDCLHICSRG